MVGTFSSNAQEITYTIYNDLDSLPLTDIPVELHLRKRRTEEFLFLVKTDSSGTVVFKDLEKGAYSIHIKHPDFELENVYVNLKKRETDNGAIYLHHNTAKKKELMKDVIMEYASMKSLFKDSLQKMVGSDVVVPTPEELQKLRDELMAIIVYPKMAVEDGLQGKVKVAFICNSNHEILKMAILNSVDEMFDIEVMYGLYRLKRLPIQKDDDHPFVMFSIPIKFKLK